MQDLRPWLAPRSIAIVGASSTSPYASRLIDNLGSGGFAVDTVVVVRTDGMGGPEMAHDSSTEGSYAPLGLPRPQRSSRPGQAGALLDITRGTVGAEP